MFTSGPGSPPQPPRRVQHVEVRAIAERCVLPVEDEARLEHGHVERLAVVGDQRAAALEPLAHRESRARSSACPTMKYCRTRNAAGLEPAAPNQEGVGAGTARQAGCLEIQEHDVATRQWATGRPVDAWLSSRHRINP